MVSPAYVVCAVVAVSDAVTVNAKFPTAVGVPLMRLTNRLAATASQLVLATLIASQPLLVAPLLTQLVVFLR